jgi:hypothetical protein
LERGVGSVLSPEAEGVAHAVETAEQVIVRSEGRNEQSAYLRLPGSEVLAPEKDSLALRFRL